jgi:hypothetical protein
VRFGVVSVASDGKAAGGVPVSSENDRGLCLKITYLRFRMAACGDVNGMDKEKRADVESAVARSFGRVDLVEVNHHGSRYSSNATFINALRPAVAVISAGGVYGHPTDDVIARWKRVGATVYTTQDKFGKLADGTVTVTTQGTRLFRVRTDGSGEFATFKLSGGGKAPSPPDITDPLEEVIPGAGTATIIAGAAAGMLRSRRKRSPLAAVFAVIDAMRSRAEDAEERVREAWQAASKELERLERRNGKVGDAAGKLRKDIEAAVTGGKPKPSEITDLEEAAWDLEDLLT